MFVQCKWECIHSNTQSDCMNAYIVMPWLPYVFILSMDSNSPPSPPTRIQHSFRVNHIEAITVDIRSSRSGAQGIVVVCAWREKKKRSNNNNDSNNNNRPLE